MKLTLLQIVNRMLNTCEGERVASVGDTEESLMCVDLANDSYYQMMADKKWKHLRVLSELEAHTELNQLKCPTGTLSIDPHNVYYDGGKIDFTDPDLFLARTITRDETESTVDVMGEYKIVNNKNPSYFTSDNDEILVFDAVPNAISGLDATKSKAFIYRISLTELSDDAEYFDLPAQAFPALLSLCKSYAAYELKGDENLGNLHLRAYLKRMSALVKTGRYIDEKPDIRKRIIARPTRRNANTLRLTISD